MSFPPHILARARNLYPHTALRKIYLNHAGTGPVSSKIMNAMSSYFIERSSGAIDTVSTDLPRMAECRMLIRRLINAEGTDRIAFTTNTSDALNIAAAGLPWKSGDRILLNRAEFPANVYPYHNLRTHGVEIDFLETPDGVVTPELIAGGIRERTRLVGLSAVQYLSGYRSDLAAVGEICRNRGILFVVDGIQAVGAVQIDVQGMKIDALAAGGQKWQMAGQGIGFLYVTEELQNRIRPAHFGWLGVREPMDYSNLRQDPADTARRFETGTQNIPGIWGMHAALSTLLEFGLKEIEDQIMKLTRTLIDGFRETDGVSMYSPDDDRQRAGIVTITLPDAVDPKNVFTMLAAQEITTGLRQSKLRYSPHFYMSQEEMEATIEATRESLVRSRR
jgi:selenocysteine lyase/cysteine desulfurase